LGTESRIAQTWASVFSESTAISALAAITAITHPVAPSLTWTAHAPIAAGASVAVARTRAGSAITPSRGFGFLLPGTVIAAHRHHRLGRFGLGWRWCRSGFSTAHAFLANIANFALIPDVTLTHLGCSGVG
jgi:hypothetical protein